MGKPGLLNFFLEKYLQGEFLQALQALFPTPSATFDDANDGDLALQYILNYMDASVFEGQAEALRTYKNQLEKVLQSVISENPQKNELLIQFLTMMIFENYLTHLQKADPTASITEFPLELKSIASLAKFQYPFMADAIESLKKETLQRYQPLIEKKQKIWKNWRILAEAKPALATRLNQLQPSSRFQFPWQLFSYPLPLTKKVVGNANDFPIIFLEPLEKANYAEFLKPYQGKPALFVLQPGTNLFQLLQFEDIAQAFLEPKHYLYLLDEYPHDQLNVQQFSWGEAKAFQIVLTTSNPQLEAFLPALTKAFTQCFAQSKKEAENDSPAGTALYRVAKNFIFNHEALRYGPNGFAALKAKTQFFNWFDSHKSPAPPQTDLGPPSIDYLTDTLTSLNTSRQPRPLKGPRLKLAHVTAQLIDTGHAPTKLLTSLITNRNTEDFEVTVIVTERLKGMTLEYPTADASTNETEKSGHQTIRNFQDQGVQVFLNPTTLTLRDTATQIAYILKENNIDVVVFHGPDEIHDYIGALTDVPLRILFEHGTPPTYPCYDLFLSSTAETSPSLIQKVQKLGIKALPLNFSYDPTPTWEPLPYSKEKLGLPENSFVMTTVSNHLETRLNPEMCDAIAEILKRNSNAYYAPIGRIDNPANFLNLFSKYGIADRVISIGSVPNPSQYARSMNLYLNEFPFGSCLGMLDAMAAGCPVVSMYDENGPPQSIYGAAYFGLDRIVKSPKEYIELACRLITDKALYKEWSNHALKKFKERADIKAYVKRFEDIIHEAVSHKNF